MAVGRLPNSEGAGDDDGGAIVAEINITPLTDIFLVLLIIFMITSSAMIESGPQVSLPETGATTSEGKGIVITVDPQRNLFVNGQATSSEALRETLRAAVDASDSKRVVLQGDRSVVLGEVVNILDEARAAGAKEVAIGATRKP